MAAEVEGIEAPNRCGMCGHVARAPKGGAWWLLSQGPLWVCLLCDDALYAYRRRRYSFAEAPFGPVAVPPSIG